MLSRDRDRCNLAHDFEWIVRESIFNHLKEDTTPEQYEQAIANLQALFESFAAKVKANPFHHPSIGRGIGHQCVQDSYEKAIYYLKSRMLLVVPKPEPPAPAPRQQTLTPEEVVNNLEGMLPRLPKETFVGEEQIEEQGGT